MVDNNLNRCSSLYSCFSSFNQNFFVGPYWNKGIMVYHSADRVQPADGRKSVQIIQITFKEAFSNDETAQLHHNWVQEFSIRNISRISLDPLLTEKQTGSRKSTTTHHMLPIVILQMSMNIMDAWGCRIKFWMLPYVPSFLIWIYQHQRYDNIKEELRSRENNKITSNIEANDLKL
ncbi:1658_t:CDS:2 [Funneliformis mosseae]|uniref:1658_t:CDS:1 n=1 Tax=Funneliformis mosseae TaxID=27381 RepID=A0A9N8WST8_FUNMO|nr:1658_t:CDS:2 [Funneliformis mosseae]